MTSSSNGSQQHAVTETQHSAHDEINALVSGVQWSKEDGAPLVLTYSFPWAAGAASFDSSYSTSAEQAQGIALSAMQQAAVRGALAAWSSVANIQFVEVADSAASVGDMRFASTSAKGLGAAGWGYYPSAYWTNGGDVWISNDTSERAKTAEYWKAGGEGFSLLMHEVGHALGLKHGFEDEVQLPEAMDNRQYTVMAYDVHPNGISGAMTATANGYQYSYSYMAPETLMALDIATVQHMYGANNSFQAGNNVYSFDPAHTTLKTIWDAGGVDTLDVSLFSRSVTLDLAPGAYSSLPGVVDAKDWKIAVPLTYGKDNLAIAYGTTIENATGGSADDKLFGNNVDNQLKGGAGNDYLDGRGGLDTAVFSGVRASYNISIQSDDSVRVTDTRANKDGSDLLVNVERAQFADGKVAFDLDGNAGFVAKLIGAIYGADSVKIPSLVGLGLSYVDNGVSFEQLTQAALNDRLGANYSNQECVNLLYQNLTGEAAPAGDMAYWQSAIQGGSLSTEGLAQIAFAHSANVLNIDLAGLQQDGVAYL